MKVFISYSGTKSAKMAEVASRFLEQLLPDVTFFRSASDIALGSHWLQQVEQVYSGADVALVCITRDNIEKPWLLYEIGALSANNVRIIPFLLDIRPSDLSGPIALYQAVSADKIGVWKLIQFLHSLLDNATGSTEKNHVFENIWPAFLASLEAIRETPSTGGNNVVNVLSGADVIHFATHGNVAQSIIVPGNHDVVISGDIVSPEKPRKEQPTTLSAEQAFERINAAVRQNLQQLKENLEQARSQSSHFFKLTIGFASAGFLIIVGAVVLLLAGQVPAGIVASIASLIPEASAALFFKKDSELRKIIESYNQHIINSQQTLTMIDLSETIKDESERDRIKRDIILRVLDISHESVNTGVPNKTPNRTANPSR